MKDSEPHHAAALCGARPLHLAVPPSLRRTLTAFVPLLLLVGLPAARAAEFFLRAAAFTNTMPDGVSVVMWGFARDSAFGARDGTVTSPGPTLTVPPGDNVLTIRLDNDLPDPISIVINGQFPSNAPAPVRDPDGRVRSFTHETPPGNGAPVTYTWPNVRPGTFLYLTGTRPQVQVQMGLYGALKKDAANGFAYLGVSYSSDLVLLFSEIDPALHEAVATGNYGPGKPITSTIDYLAKYFLINGVPFSPGQPVLPAGDPGRTNLLRLLNAGLDTRVPIVNGAYLRLIAEDGNPYPFPKSIYAVHLPAQKTTDALFVEPAGTNAVYDRRLGLVNGTNAPGGMLTYLAVAFTPPRITSQPASQTVQGGATVTFHVAASGSTPLSYQWRSNGVNLVNGAGVSGATSPTLTLANVQAFRAGVYSVVVTNAFGTATSSDAQLTVLTLPEAVDAPALVWTTGGASNWVAQTAITHDGLDAAQSGSIGHGQESWMQTTVTGPGTLTFWWKVSSEPANDRLRLMVNGSEVLRLSGEVDWQFQTVTLGSGTQTLRWRYNKNSSVTSGQDRGWLDQVLFTPPGPPTPPMIVSQPVGQSVLPGTTATFTVAATGTAPLIYRWRFNNTPLSNGGDVSGATSPTLTLVNVQPARAGNYSVTVSNSAGGVVSSDALLTVLPPPPALTIPEAVDAPALVFQQGGNAAWIPQTLVTHDGVDAARSGVITADQSSRLETFVNGPGVISFWWKVSSESLGDQLRFYVGSTELARISGEVDWQFRSFSVPAGTGIILKWRYSKNSSGTAGQDAGWVDQIQFTP